MRKDKRDEKYLKLKQENKELKKLIKSHGEIIFNQAELINKIQFDINQEKINKAIEYIQNHQPIFRLNTKKQLEEMYDEFYKNILEILGEK